MGYVGGGSRLDWYSFWDGLGEFLVLVGDVVCGGYWMVLVIVVV